MLHYAMAAYQQDSQAVVLRHVAMLYVLSLCWLSDPSVVLHDWLDMDGTVCKDACSMISVVSKYII